MDLKEEDILGDAIYGHWYYISKGRALRDILRGIKADALIDVGAGSGIFSKQMMDAGRTRHALCVDPGYSVENSQPYAGGTLEFARNAPAGHAADLALMMDVLEHVDDDRALLRQYAGHVKPGGYVLITVPAFRFLWSGHDVFLEHRRRYTASMIRDCVHDSRLEIVRVRFFFGLLFPLIALIRIARGIMVRGRMIDARSDMKPVPGWINRALIWAHDLERRTIFPFNGLAGLSIFCLCRRF